jgi:hypothetical protein
MTNLAARRREGEVSLDLAFEAAASVARERAELRVEAELLAVVSDKVEDREHGLVAGTSEAPAELLQEDGRTFGRSKEQDRVDVRQVEALIEEVSGEEHVDPPLLQVLESTFALSLRSVAADGSRGDARLVEGRRHELRVGDADAESECPHGAGLEDLVAELLENDGRTAPVTCVDVGQLVLVVAAASPRDPSQIGAIRDGEVVEGAEKLRSERIPETKFRCGATAEEAAHVNAIGTLRRRGEAEKFLWLEVVEDPAVRRCFCVVELVNDHDVVRVGGDVLHPIGVQRLDACEDVALRHRFGFDLFARHRVCARGSATAVRSSPRPFRRNR